MCGICGFISRKLDSEDNLAAMSNLLAHRGPDDHGEEIYQIQGGKYVGFAHRRLSILDLSDKGHQPMHSKDRRISVVFNGEIYNYGELKRQLKDYIFVSACDTEIIIAAYLRWGIDFVKKINGMFAIALLDRKNGEVYLIRDRIGKKPLYYYMDNDNNLVFASELKAICQSGLFRKNINKDILGRYLYRGYIIAPDTIYQNTYKLRPGELLKISDRGMIRWKYWDVAESYNIFRHDLVIDYDQAKYELKMLLKQAVRRRMIADVPLGAFLSGGYDSSLVCALASEISEEPLRTFSIGFHDAKYNEAVFARQIADRLGADHTELYLSEQDAFKIVDSIPQYYDEPFADSSQIPTMLVSELAKKDVSVVLSGDGGDELFGGYNIYSTLQRAERLRMQGILLHYLGKIPMVKKSAIWQKRDLTYRIVSDDRNREARTQGGVNTYFDIINGLLLNETSNFYYEFESRYQEKRYDVTRMLLDMDTYLPEDILTKVDRASMRYALECRCPILDKEVVEYSFRIPPDYKNDHGNQKRIIKDIVYDYFPKEIMERPKSGFGIPLDKWMRTVLKERIMDWTNRDYLFKQGIFKPDNVCLFISEYMENGDQGKNSGRNFSMFVWAYFIFQQWYDRYMCN